MHFFCVCMKHSWRPLTLDKTNSYSDLIGSWRTLFLPHFFLADVFFNPESWGNGSSFAFYILRKICLTVWQQRLLICPLPVGLSARLPFFSFFFYIFFYYLSICLPIIRHWSWVTPNCLSQTEERDEEAGQWMRGRAGWRWADERERNKAEHKTAGACNSVS